MQHILSQQRQRSPLRFTGAIRLFPPSLQALAACGKAMVDSITRVFPPVSQVQSALCPGVTGFHQPNYYVSVKRRSPVLDAQLVTFVLNQEANTTGILLTIDNPIQYIVKAHLFAAFSRHLSRYDPLIDRPAVLRWLCADDL